MRKTKLTRRIKQDLSRFIHKRIGKGGEDPVAHIWALIQHYNHVRGYDLDVEQAYTTYVEYKELE